MEIRLDNERDNCYLDITINFILLQYSYL